MVNILLWLAEKKTALGMRIPNVDLAGYQWPMMVMVLLMKT